MLWVLASLVYEGNGHLIRKPREWSWIDCYDDPLSGEHAELARPERVRQFKQYIRELESKYSSPTLLADI